jgi:hypothetical protein
MKQICYVLFSFFLFSCGGENVTPIEKLNPILQTDFVGKWVYDDDENQFVEISKSGELFTVVSRIPSDDQKGYQTLNFTATYQTVGTDFDRSIRTKEPPGVGGPFVSFNLRRGANRDYLTTTLIKGVHQKVWGK